MGSRARVCRACKHGVLHHVLSFGKMPLAEQLLRADEIDKPHPMYPLDLVFCTQCFLLQIADAVPRDLLYQDDYSYYSSAIPEVVDHFTLSAEEIIKRHEIGQGKRVIEIGSNDGYMLKVLADRGIEVLGIDPSMGPASFAEAAGIPTICEFFGFDVAERISSTGKLGDVVVANYILNLVDDLDDFVSGIGLLLKDNGVVIIQASYLREIIEKCAYDMIFHQNVCYFSVTSLYHLFRRHGLNATDVDFLPSFMGGSVRICFGREGTACKAVYDILEEEHKNGVDDIEYYRQFAKRVEAKSKSLRKLLYDLKSDGKRIVVYGAGGGMATTLLNYVGIDRCLVEYAVDINPHKHGKFTVGNKLEIFPPSRLIEDQPDFVLLLAWNYAKEIINAQRKYCEKGGRFIVPIPEPHIVGLDGLAE
jgi:SAM-dependent methyltransferase